MMTGFDTALSEITLVLFTTLAPSGVVAFILMSLPVLSPATDAALRQRLNLFLSIPLVVSMVGLVASATHLGNPANALYVFMGVGRSPLSTEVFCAVVFLALAGLYWLYTFAEHPRVVVQRVWLALAMVAGVVFVVAVAFAYDAETIVSWNTAYVPVNLILNALVGGPILAIVGLRLSHWQSLAGKQGRMLVALSFLALLANTVCFTLQGLGLSAIENSFVTAEQLVPGYGFMVAAFAVLSLAGIVLDARALDGHPVRAAFAALLVLSGIFVMRFAFYMMHMTTGLGV